MYLRILSAAILAPLVLALLWWARPVQLLLAVGLLGSLCLKEYSEMMRAIGLGSRLWLGLAGFWLLTAGLYWWQSRAVSLLAAVLLIFFVAALRRRDAPRQRFLALAADFLGAMYFGVCLHTLVAVRYAFGERLGLSWVLVLLAVIWAGDIAALLTGRSWGRTPLAPSISPRKTWEGALGGLLAGILAAWAIQQFFLGELPLAHVLVLAVVLGIMGQLGDLAESLIKRAAGAKDSSGLIPGHGGVLDRIDSLLFAFPTLYIYLSVLYA